VEKEIMENPVLEEENEEAPESADKTSPTEAPESPSTDNEQENNQTDPILEKARDSHQTDVVESLREGGRFEEKTWDLFNESQEYSDYGDSEWGGRESANRDQEKRDFAEASITRAETLTDHLEWQLLLVATSEREKALGKVLIGNLDESGYLTDTVAHIAGNQGVSVAEAEHVLGIIQGFEPTGVGARDLRECLLLQLETKTGELAAKAYQVVSNHFEDMEKRRYANITKALNYGTEELRQILAFISNLEPKPGRSFQDSDTKYITPDVFVRKIEGEYVVVLNDEPVPKLHISPYYRRLLKDKKAMNGKETKKFLENKIQSALWLIKNIEQRRKTIFRVTEAIAKIQQGFLDYGIGALKPLTLRQIADMIGMHESTVSRVTTHKYVQTPRGLFELKFFFTSGLESVDGLDVSSMSVKERIKELIHQESPQKPYSDQKIMQILTEQGLSIARRTIAKYREELRISSASQRRKI
jgi:RNA polymerase sigma-54 factor